MMQSSIDYFNPLLYKTNQSMTLLSSRFLIAMFAATSLSPTTFYYLHCLYLEATKLPDDDASSWSDEIQSPLPSRTHYFIISHPFKQSSQPNELRFTCSHLKGQYFQIKYNKFYMASKVCLLVQEISPNQYKRLLNNLQYLMGLDIF